MKVNLPQHLGVRVCTVAVVFLTLIVSSHGQGTSPRQVQWLGAPLAFPGDEHLEAKVERLRAELAAAEKALALSKQTGRVDRAEPTVAEVPTGALVVVDGHNGSGSGFLANIKGRTFFVTNIHVLGAARGADIRTIDGDAVQLGTLAYASTERDIAIVPVDWDGAVFRLSPSLRFDEVEIGQKVTVLGNSSGARVATRLQGVIKGIGPDELEVSTKFVPGNSGSPIVHDTLGTVVAIASHLKDYTTKSKWTKDTEFNEIRRFGYRMDGEIEWEQVSLEQLYAQGETYRRFEDRTEVMWNVSYMLSYESQLLTGYRNHPSIGHLYEDISSDFNWGRGTASAHNTQMLRRFVRGMMNEVQNDLSDTDQVLSLQFYRNRFTRIKGYREMISSNLARFSESRL